MKQGLDARNARIEQEREIEVIRKMDKFSTPDPNYVVGLLQRESLYSLGGGDGCACAHFQIDNVYVAVSCHKSTGCDKPECRTDGPLVHVYSHYMDWQDSDGQPVADEIVKQLRKSYYTESDIKVSLHEPKFKNARGEYVR